MHFLAQLLLLLCLRGLSFESSDTRSLWSPLSRAFVEYHSKRVDYLIENLVSITNSSELSSECRKSVFFVLKSLSKGHLFAYQMFDSSSSFPPQGLLTGTVTELGDYDQCLQINSAPEVVGKPQMCLVSVSVPLPPPNTPHLNLNHGVDGLLPPNSSDSSVMRHLSSSAVFFYLTDLRFALCVPSKCRSSDVLSLSRSALIRSGLSVKSVDCNTDSVDFLFLHFLALLISSLLVAFTLIAFFVSLFPPSFRPFVKAFRLEDNIRRVFRTDNCPELRSLDGIRVLTISYIIIAHQIEYTDWSLYKNTFAIRHSLSSVFILPLSKVHTIVETFFVLSGFLAAHTTLKRVKCFSVFAYVWTRVLRLWPLMAVFVVLTTLLPLMGSGPVWNSFLSSRIDSCHSNWWQNLLFLHNLIDSSRMCIDSTWFLSVDMQCHLLSVLVVAVLVRRPRFALLISALLICISMTIVSVVILVNDFSAGRVSTQIGPYFLQEFRQLVYYQPWPHLAVYFVGFSFGICFNLWPQFRLKKKQQLFLWLFVFLCFGVALYDTAYWTGGEHPNNRYISAIVYPLARILWSIGICCVIYLSEANPNSLLKWRFFVPLSRVSYSLYLTHVWVVWWWWASRRRLPSTSASEVFSSVCQTIFISFLMAFLVSVVIESPIARLQSWVRCLVKDGNGTNATPVRTQ